MSVASLQWELEDAMRYVRSWKCTRQVVRWVIQREDYANIQ